MGNVGRLEMDLLAKRNNYMHGESFLTIILPAWWVCTYTMRNWSCVLMKVMLKSCLIIFFKVTISLFVVWTHLRILPDSSLQLYHATVCRIYSHFQWLYIIYFSKIINKMHTSHRFSCNSHLLGAAMARWARPATGVGLLQTATWPHLQKERMKNI